MTSLLPALAFVGVVCAIPLVALLILERIWK